MLEFLTISADDVHIMEIGPRRMEFRTPEQIFVFPNAVITEISEPDDQNECKVYYELGTGGKKYANGLL